MLTNVSFRSPHEFVRVSEQDGILATSGASWFVEILNSVPGIEIEHDLVQEDWGVIVFVELGGKRFWIGLSRFEDGGSDWLAHVHHASWSPLVRMLPSGKGALSELAVGLHRALSAKDGISSIRWFTENEMRSGKISEGRPEPK